MKLRTVVAVVMGLGVGTLAGEGGMGAIAFIAPIEASAKQATTATDAALEALASHLEGVMTTTAQAADNPDFVGVQMTTCRVMVPDPQADSIYLYQEQALVEDLGSPYRQRFLQLTPGENGRLDSRTFKPETPSNWTGLCAQPDPFVFLHDLDEPVCTVSLRIAAIGGFVGSTPAEGCTANVRGAVRITNVVVLHEAGMDTWDRGFDEQGNRVWGAQDIPYRYRR